MKNKFMILSAILVLGACTPSVVQIDSPAKRESEPTYYDTNNRYFWGVTGNETFDVSKICGKSGLNSIETSDDFVNGMWNFFSLGIYMPASYAFYCNK